MADITGTAASGSAPAGASAIVSSAASGAGTLTTAALHVCSMHLRQIGSFCRRGLAVIRKGLFAAESTGEGTMIGTGIAFDTAAGPAVAVPSGWMGQTCGTASSGQDVNLRGRKGGRVLIAFDDHGSASSVTYRTARTANAASSVWIGSGGIEAIGASLALLPDHHINLVTFLERHLTYRITAITAYQGVSQRVVCAVAQVSGWD